MRPKAITDLKNSLDYPLTLCKTFKTAYHDLLPYYENQFSLYFLTLQTKVKTGNRRLDAVWISYTTKADFEAQLLIYSICQLNSLKVVSTSKEEHLALSKEI